MNNIHIINIVNIFVVHLTERKNYYLSPLSILKKNYFSSLYFMYTAYIHDKIY